MKELNLRQFESCTCASKQAKEKKSTVQTQPTLLKLTQ